MKITSSVFLLATMLVGSGSYADTDFCKRDLGVVEAVSLNLAGKPCKEIQLKDLQNIKSLGIDYSHNPPYGNQLTANDFVGLDNLMYLSIFRVNMSNDPPITPLHLESGIFKSMPGLRGLLLTGNIIITPEIFIGLTNLVSLRLDGTHVSEITSNYFSPLSSLESLIIDDWYHSSIVKIDAFAFSGLSNLKLLVVDTASDGAEIDETAFSGLKNLEKLNSYAAANSSGFRLKNVPLKLFSDLTKLSELTFKSYGEIAVGTFANQTNLDKLHIELTQKQYAPHLLMLPALEHLTLAGPGFFPDHFFKDMPNLKYLHFYFDGDRWDLRNADVPQILFCIADDCAPGKVHP